ncbi:MAG: YkvA family protein [Fimbriimonadaceae bacterium]
MSRRLFVDYFSKIKERAKALKLQVRTLAIALKHPKLPLAARILGVIVVAYALSPIDLIPDFIPILGLLDDIILIPLGITLLIKIIPIDIWEESRTQAESTDVLPQSRLGLLLIPLTWIIVGATITALTLSRRP